VGRGRCTARLPRHANVHASPAARRQQPRRRRTRGITNDGDHSDMSDGAGSTTACGTATWTKGRLANTLGLRQGAQTLPSASGGAANVEDMQCTVTVTAHVSDFTGAAACTLRDGERGRWGDVERGQGAVGVDGGQPPRVGEGHRGRCFGTEQRRQRRNAQRTARTTSARNTKHGAFSWTTGATTREDSHGDLHRCDSTAMNVASSVQGVRACERVHGCSGACGGTGMCDRQPRRSRRDFGEGRQNRVQLGPVVSSELSYRDELCFRPTLRHRKVRTERKERLVGKAQ
jgi:hypothetical protein